MRLIISTIFFRLRSENQVKVIINSLILIASQMTVQTKARNSKSKTGRNNQNAVISKSQKSHKFKSALVDSIFNITPNMALSKTIKNSRRNQGKRRQNKDQTLFEDSQPTLKIRKVSSLVKQKSSQKIQAQTQIQIQREIPIPIPIQMSQKKQQTTNWNDESINVLRKTVHRQKQGQSLHQLQTKFYIQKITTLQKALIQKQKMIKDLKNQLIGEQQQRNKYLETENKRLRQEKILIVKQNQLLKLIVQKQT